MNPNAYNLISLFREITGGGSAQISGMLLFDGHFGVAGQALAFGYGRLWKT
jgi:hypothetical protein